MTTIEPPSGFPDLNGQANSVEDERAQLAREKAAFEQEMALVRQRREREDRQEMVDGRPLVLEPTGDPVPQESAGPSIPAVVNAEDSEYEIDIDTGKPIIGSDGQPIRKWPYQTIEIDGYKIQVRKPRPEALSAVAMAGSSVTPAKLQSDLITRFVKNHISELSFGTLLSRMMDPEDSFTMDDFGKLFTEIATLETGRPTGPSRS
ncbi:hypothetical protein [Nocardia nova]|uniref:hypothetical protein n=1 Tax=Nocardia nova TaxID=37330 RepID=UPI0018935707|nr:hypothetical protein [Nocardia nova]MBF6277086.1 hypothetical protein [Nocardia nova]